MEHEQSIPFSRRTTHGPGFKTSPHKATYQHEAEGALSETVRILFVSLGLPE